MVPVKKRRAPLPSSDPEGNILQNYGKRHAECVAIAFEMIGGVDRLADWASKNPGDFFTKLWSKTIPKEVEHKAHDSVEALLDRLDDKTIDGVAVCVDERLVDDI